LRGSNSSHVLVMIDGVEINDPISIGRSPQISDIPLSNVKRIEVIEGPQSTLYGSDAVSGVINIITGGEKSNVILTGGNRGSFKQELTLNQEDEKGNQYHLSLYNYKTDGISAAGEKYGNLEKDGFKNKGFNFQVKTKLNTNLEWKNSFLYYQGKTQIDNQGGVYGDDPNRTFNRKDFYAMSNLTYRKKKYEQVFTFNYSRHRYFDYNLTDFLHPQDSLMSGFFIAPALRREAAT